MKLSKKPCRVVGVRLGEASITLLNLSQPGVSAKFVLLGDGGQNSGSYTKTSWSKEVWEAFEKFVEAVETDALKDLFDDDQTQAVTEQPTNLSFPTVPQLGGTKRNDTP